LAICSSSSCCGQTPLHKGLAAALDPGNPPASAGKSIRRAQPANPHGECTTLHTGSCTRRAQEKSRQPQGGRLASRTASEQLVPRCGQLRRGEVKHECKRVERMFRHELRTCSHSKPLVERRALQHGPPQLVCGCIVWSEIGPADSVRRVRVVPADSCWSISQWIQLAGPREWAGTTIAQSHPATAATPSREIGEMGLRGRKAHMRLAGNGDQEYSNPSLQSSQLSASPPTTSRSGRGELILPAFSDQSRLTIAEKPKTPGFIIINIIKRFWRV